MHIAIVMNTAWGVRTLRSDLIRFLQSLRHHVSVVSCADTAAIDLQRMGVTFENWAVTRAGLNPVREGLAILRAAPPTRAHTTRLDIMLHAESDSVWIRRSARDPEH